MKTEQEILDFQNLPNIELNDIDSSQTSNTNFYVITGNFKLFQAQFINLSSFVKNIYNIINIQSIVSQVLTSLETNKNVLDIDTNLVIGNSVTQNIGQKIYRILRFDEYHIVITGDNILNWDVDNIMCQVKDINGMIVYPTIVTKDNKIDLYFNDMLGTNYKIFWF